jgi:hypothetical protein
MKAKEPWQIAAARYCSEHSESGFDEKELRTYIQSNYSVSDGHLSQFLEEEIHLPPGNKFSRTARGGLWIPPLDLVSKVTDYDELQEARLSSKRAMYTAIASLVFASIVGIAQIIIQIYTLVKVP